MITAIANARVFDGERLLPHSPVVLLDGEKVAAISAAVPSGTHVIDGTGATLLPGLIDSHVHTTPDGLKTALAFGVTTVLEMGAERTFCDREMIAGNDEMADIRSAGIPLSAPCGHPNELISKPKNGRFSVSDCDPHTQAFPTPSTPKEAIEFVDKRIAEGSDYIKILVEDGSVSGSPGLPVPREDVLIAAVSEAHRHAKMVIAHALTFAAAAEVIQIGVDGLSHIFLDKPHTAEIIEAIARSGIFVIPCLVLNRSITGSSAADFAADPRVAQRLSQEWIKTLQGCYNTYPQGNFGDVLETVAALKRSGVSLLVGTDVSMPNPKMGGLAEGASVHHELQLLVEAGLTPVEALRAATSVPARIFGLIDRGRIAPGARADLLLVDGNPTENISDSLSIRNVWRRGALQKEN